MLNKLSASGVVFLPLSSKQLFGFIESIPYDAVNGEPLLGIGLEHTSDEILRRIYGISQR